MPVLYSYSIKKILIRTVRVEHIDLLLSHHKPVVLVLRHHDLNVLLALLSKLNNHLHKLSPIAQIHPGHKGIY